MSRLLVMLLLLVLAACSGAPAPEETPPEPRELLTEVIEQLREVETFHLIIEQTGAPYAFGVTLDQGQTVVNATMRRAEGQYRSPDELYAQVNLRVGALPPVNVDIYAQSIDQWFRLASSDWINYPVAEGFDPGGLLAEGRGFMAALDTLEELEYIGAETLVDGTPVYHVRGNATGRTIDELLFNLLMLGDTEVQVDVYIDRETRIPALMELLLPDTATADEPDTVWSIEVFNVNEAVTIPDVTGRSS